MNEQYTLTNAVLPPSTITFYTNRPEPNTKVMEITKDGIWVNPDVSVDDTAKAVLDVLDVYIKKLVKEVVHQEREACAKVCDGWPDYDVQGLAEAIRARGEK
jgi:hypothetical protein